MHGIWISDASRRKIIEDKQKGHNSRSREVVAVLFGVGPQVTAQRRFPFSIDSMTRPKRRR